VELRDAAQALNDQVTAQKLSLTYREVAKLIRSGQLADQAQAALFLSHAQRMVLDKDVAKWKPVTDILAAHWAALVQEGASVGGFADYLDKEAAAGLDAAIDPARELDPIWITLIMKIIEMLIDLLNANAGPFAAMEGVGE
jgi:hypothetical protein